MNNMGKLKAIKVNIKDIPLEEIVECRATPIEKIDLDFYDEGTYLFISGEYYKIISKY
jgi:hypothetical protein